MMLSIREKLVQQLQDLPERSLPEVLTFVEYLTWKSASQGEDKPLPVGKGNRQPGTAKGMIVMADDFDEPLEDFKEYME